jgi:hypothetical protein
MYYFRRVLRRAAGGAYNIVGFSLRTPRRVLLAVRIHHMVGVKVRCP